jgi:hypothetical protein
VRSHTGVWERVKFPKFGNELNSPSSQIQRGDVIGRSVPIKLPRSFLFSALEVLDFSFNCWYVGSTCDKLTISNSAD